MKRSEVMECVRMMRFRDVFGRQEAGELSQVEAAELLGIGERTFRRWSVRYEEDGETGLKDRRFGKASAKQVPATEAEAVARLYRDRYLGFTAKHFHEHLVRDHNFRWSYSWTKLFLQRRKLVVAAPRRGAHRRKRERRPLPGMMLHQDGSTHRWIAGLDRDVDLIVTMDDATSEIYSAFLIDQ
jgi:transposase